MEYMPTLITQWHTYKDRDCGKIIPCAILLTCSFAPVKQDKNYSFSLSCYSGSEIFGSQVVSLHKRIALEI